MLTATYSLVAMSVEQKRAWECLERIRQAVMTLWQDPQRIDRECVEAACSGLTRFECYCHERKLEKYVIPTVRGASCEIDAVVQQLDSLNGAGMRWLGAAREQLQALLDRHATQAQEFASGLAAEVTTQVSGAVDAYCECQRQRLLQEEELLLPLVRRFLSVEDWFMLAAKFLGDEQPRRTASLRAALQPPS